jgi:hypothetical protein
VKLTIHLSDGRMYPFIIAEGKASEDFLKTVKFWEVFDRPILRIHDGKDTWTFNPDVIEKIHFQTTSDPGWRPPENILAAKSISPESYRHKLSMLEAKPQQENQFQEGKFLETVLTITLASGGVEYFECLIMLRQRREQMINLYNLFQKVAFTIPCEQGGFVLINPKRIVCIHMHPSPPEDPDSAWLVDGPAGLTPE